MRKSKICALVGRGAVIAILGAAAVTFAASPAAARSPLGNGEVVTTPLTFEWGFAPTYSSDDEIEDTGLEERTFEWG